jgi:hypothetical protein
MTNQAQENTEYKGIMGVRNDGVAVSEVCGVVGGLLGGVVAVAQGQSVGAGVVGAVAGAIGGYGMGTLLSPFSNHCGTGAKILTGAISASFGISCAQLGAMVGGSIGKVSGL